MDSWGNLASCLPTTRSCGSILIPLLHEELDRLAVENKQAQGRTIKPRLFQPWTDNRTSPVAVCSRRIFIALSTASRILSVRDTTPVQQQISTSSSLSCELALLSISEVLVNRDDIVVKSLCRAFFIGVRSSHPPEAIFDCAFGFESITRRARERDNSTQPHELPSRN